MVQIYHVMYLASDGFMLDKLLRSLILHWSELQRFFFKVKFSASDCMFHYRKEGFLIERCHILTNNPTEATESRY